MNDRGRDIPWNRQDHSFPAFLFLGISWTLLFFESQNFNCTWKRAKSKILQSKRRIQKNMKSCIPTALNQTSKHHLGLNHGGIKHKVLYSPCRLSAFQHHAVLSRCLWKERQYAKNAFREIVTHQLQHCRHFGKRSKKYFRLNVWTRAEGKVWKRGPPSLKSNYLLTNLISQLRHKHTLSHLSVHMEPQHMVSLTVIKV